MFQDYAIYHWHFDPAIRMVSLHGFKHLLVSDIEEFIGKQVNIESYFDYIDDEQVNSFKTGKN